MYSEETGTGIVLAALASVPPDIPRPLLVQPPLLPQRPDLIRLQSFILPIIPLSNILCIDTVLLSRSRTIRPQLQQLKRLRRPNPRADEHMRDTRRVNESSWTDEHFRRRRDLLSSCGREFDVRDTRVSPGLGPLRLP